MLFFCLLFYGTFFYPHISADFLFIFYLNLGDLSFSSCQAKLMAVQELIVQACVWLPVAEWM